MVHIPPDEQDANATPASTDDESSSDSAAAKLFGAENVKEEMEPQPTEEEQPEAEEASEEPFATFGSRSFKDKDELLSFVKKVHGDNSRLVGQLKQYEKVKAESEAKVPQGTTNSTTPELEAAKRALDATLSELGYVKQDALNPILQERLDREVEATAKFIEEHTDFWEVEEDVMKFDGHINPRTGKTYTIPEAYRIVMSEKNPDGKGFSKGFNEAKKRVAAQKQAAVGSKKASGDQPKEGYDIMDALLNTKM